LRTQPNRDLSKGPLYELFQDALSQPVLDWARERRTEYTANRRILEEREAADRRLLEVREAAARRLARRTRYAAIALAILAGISGVLAFISIRQAMLADEQASKAELARGDAAEEASKAELARQEATADRASALDAKRQAEVARADAERARNAADEARADAETNFVDAQRRLQESRLNQFRYILEAARNKLTDGNGELASLMVLGAMRELPSSPLGSQAMSVLTRALSADRQRAVAQSDVITRPTFSPDGTQVLAGLY